MAVTKRNIKSRVTLVLTFVAGVFLQAEESRRKDAVVEATGLVMPSVVNIATKTRVQRVRYYYDWWRDNWAPYAQELPPQESAGSGVVVDAAGYVLTNVHVVKDADEIWVKINNEAGELKAYKAEVVVGSLTTDIALLKIIHGEADKTFAVANFANNGDLLLGETVLALGNPFGLGGSVSRGILSSKSRRTETEGNQLDIPDWLQTDASINPGNSGGPLINLDGEIIGINVAVLREGQGIGFAIPVKRVNEALARIFTPEFLEGNWFGAKIDAGSRPLTVTAVEPNSPAAKANMTVGDQITRINGHTPRNFIEFAVRLLDLGNNPTVQIDTKRGDDVFMRAVNLIPEKTFLNSGLIREKTGASLEALTPEVARALGFNSAEGLVVTQVDADSPADKAGLTTGLVVVAIDDNKANDIVNAARLLNRKRSGEGLKLSLVNIRRNGIFLRRTTENVTIKVL